MSHRLDRLELEIHTTSEPLARQLHDRLSRLHQRVLAELLGRVLDQFSPPGTLHRLESLELDLGEIPEEQLERLLPERLERALREALPGRLPSAEVRLTRDDGPLGIGQPSNTPEPPEGLGCCSVAQALELLEAYANTGFLPWWAPRQDNRLIPAALEAALGLPPRELVDWWRQAGFEASARQRLLVAANPPQVARLHELFGDALSEGPEQKEDRRAVPAGESSGTFAGQMTRTGRSTTGEAASRRLDLDPARCLTLLAAYASGNRLPEESTVQEGRLIPAALEVVLSLPQQLLEAWWRQTAASAFSRDRLLAAAQPQQAARLRELEWGDLEGWREESEEVESPVAAEGLTGGATPEGTSTAEDKTAHHSQRRPGRTLEAERSQPGKELSKAQPASPGQALGLPKLEASPAPRGAAPPSSESPNEPISVDGAGLVLLTPLLETLFDRLELLTPERRFQDAEAAQRAMALLGWLVRGDPRTPEWRLTLAKVLCGWPLEQLYAPEEPLSEAEQQQAEGLLQAALAHGEGVLGETIEQLQLDWLQRPGLLSWRSGAWLLVVERREGDGALDQLPWSWGWIRLPWMGDLLQVVW
ncbi:MAG: contractile injection system tape measure protein [Synechococcaceae cyanobacterium]|nr:contractile injection system tape measure protein [Synechococcaceae cyanobacterium]